MLLKDLIPGNLYCDNTINEPMCFLRKRQTDCVFFLLPTPESPENTVNGSPRLQVYEDYEILTYIVEYDTSRFQEE